jgi:hypothetical protein
VGEREHRPLQDREESRRSRITGQTRASSQVSDSIVGPQRGTDPTWEQQMRLSPALQRAVIIGRPGTHHRTAVTHGRPLPWRPPIRLVGLLELLHLSQVRFA